MLNRSRGPQPLQIEVTIRQGSILGQITRRSNSPQGLVQRAQIIRQAGEGHRNQQIASSLKVDIGSVRKWRKRWHEREGQLSEMEKAGVSDKELRQVIRESLSDLPRSGAPTKFSAEQICQIIVVSCETPEQAGRPVTHWTPPELADEVIQRSIVDSISPRQIGRFLKGGRFEAPPVTLLA